MPIDTTNTIRIMEEIIAKAKSAKDPMSQLGQSAQQATEAFQGLQEASKDLVDLEIVVPEGYPVRIPMAIEYGIPLLKFRSEPEPDIDKALTDLFREPWYKRLWNWITK